jgi:hypothetical protein
MQLQQIRYVGASIRTRRFFDLHADKNFTLQMTNLE